MLDAALGYLAAGFHPIPAEPRGKRPLVSWKSYQDVAPSDDQVRDWWSMWPDANIALVLGRGTFAVDCDTADAFNGLVADHIPAGTPLSQTAKGYHALLRGAVPDRVGAAPGVDIRGVGYIVAPPSVHPTGHVYAWVMPLCPAADLPAAPPALLALAQRRPAPAQPAAAGGDWVTDALAGVAEGGRDATCTRLAGYLIGKGLPVEAVEVVLQAWADRCTPPFPSAEVSKCVESIARRHGDTAVAGPPAGIAELVYQVVSDLDAGTSRAKATGLGRLDDLLDGGFRAGELILLGARPGVGKTALMLQVARTMAHAGVGTLIVTREMTRAALTRRLLCQESLVRFSSLKTGRLEDAERAMLAAGVDSLVKLPLWITTAKSPAEIGDALAAYDAGTVGFVIVDYLQRMYGPAELKDKRQRVEYVADALKDLAVQYDLPVLCASSLSRPPKQDSSWRPGLGDLRESGELEHGGDNVLLMYREPGAELTELNLAKQRDGQVGHLQLVFRGEYLTFEAAA